MDIWKIEEGKPERLQGERAEHYRELIESGQLPRVHVGTLDGTVAHQLAEVRRHVLEARKGLVDCWTAEKYADSASEPGVVARFDEALSRFAGNVLEGRAR